MPNEFIARNGLIAQNNTTISGSLIVTGGITGSISSASYALTASYAMNGGSGGGAAFPFTGSAVISGSLEIKNPSTIPNGSIFAPTSNFTILYASSSISQSASYNITNGNITLGNAVYDEPFYSYDASYYVIAYSNQYNSATSAGTRITIEVNAFDINFATASVQSPVTITGYDIYAFNHLNGTWYRNTSYASNPNITILVVDGGGFGIGNGWNVTSSLLSLSNNPVPVYNTFNTVGINKSSSLNGVLDINGNTFITGSLNISAGITGSLFGTASFASTASFINPLQQNILLTGSLNITGSVVITGSVAGNVTALTIASNTASLNLNNNNFFTLQLVSGSNTFINPTNIKSGQTANILVSTTGSATVSFPSTVKQVSGSLYIPTITTGTDIVTLVSFDTTSLYLANVKNLA